MKTSKRLKKPIAILGVSVCTVAMLGTMSFAKAPQQAFAATSARYVSEYDSKEDAIAAGAELNERIAEEGMVLLKNDNNTLPLKTAGKGTKATRVSLFGYASVSPAGGSEISDIDASVGVTKLTSNLYSSLSDAGYATNPVVRNAYRTWIAEGGSTGSGNTVVPGPGSEGGDPSGGGQGNWGGGGGGNAHTSDYAAKDENDTTGIKKFTTDIEYSFADYGDAAIVVLSGSSRGAKHSRQLDEVQINLLNKICEYREKGVFEKVIVLVNDSVPMELGLIKEKADAVLLVGNPGANGFNAVGKILSGEVNPSGRLVDAYGVDFTKEPAYINDVTNYIDSATNKAVNGASFIDYEEGIYTGYRWYETAAEEGALKALATTEVGNTGKNIYGDTVSEISSTYFAENSDDGYYYNGYNGVAYPFGYGMSYSEFSWEIANIDALGGSITDPDQKITIDVKVTNKGAYAGKEVVQLYYTAPWNNTMSAEKAHVVLAGFAKTDVLAPGDSETVSITVQARDLASYDYKAAKTYVLDAGDYELKLMKNSHDMGTTGEESTALSAVTYSVASQIKCDTSDQTGVKITNQFDDVNATVAKNMTVLSRQNFVETYPTAPTSAETNRTRQSLKDDLIVNVDKDYDEHNPKYNNGKAPWYVEEDEMPTYCEDESTRPETAKVKLADLIGKDYNDPLWDDLLDQLTVKEMQTLIDMSGYLTPSLEYIGKPATKDTDGPQGWTGSGCAGANTQFATAPVLASTYNTELLYEMGRMLGDQAIWGSSDTDNDLIAYNGWYSPAMNTHRNPFTGRYTEYYSEDPYLAGIMAANTVIGAREKGLYCFIKHFAVYQDSGSMQMGAQFMTNGNQDLIDESAMSGLCVWADEQTVRELYLKQFQIATELGDPGGMMTSFSRIGNTWVGGSYELLTNVVRKEWGFRGFIVTDIVLYKYMNVDQLIRAGGDAALADEYFFENYKSNVPLSTDAESLTATQLTAMRNGVKNILYITANSNAMDTPVGSAVKYSSSEIANATVGTEYTAAVDTAVLNTTYFEYAKISYKVTEGCLPAGLTLSADGKISGTPTVAGDYLFTVSAVADGYESGTAQYRIIVSDSSMADKVDAIGGEVDSVNSGLNNLGNEVKDLGNEVASIQDNVAKTDSSVSALNAIVIVALVFAALSAAGSVVVIVINLKKKN